MIPWGFRCKTRDSRVQRRLPVALGIAHIDRLPESVPRNDFPIVLALGSSGVAEAQVITEIGFQVMRRQKRLNIALLAVGHDAELVLLLQCL